VTTSKPVQAANLAAPVQTEAPAAAAAPAPVEKPQKSRTVGSAGDKEFQAVLKVISEESGVALEELTDESNFTDMGIDSLSSLVIGSRMREDLGMDLGEDFSLFISCPTVKALREFMGASSSGDAGVADEEHHTGQHSVPPAPVAASEPVPEPEPTMAVARQAPVLTSLAGDVSENFAAAVRIISEESGVAVEELTGETVFANIGIDSLSSMVISSRFKEELGLGLDSDFSLFDDVPSVSKLHEFLCGHDSSEISPGSSSDNSSSPSDSVSNCPSQKEANDDSCTNDTASDSDQPKVERVDHCRPCTSVVLQGLPRIAKRTLFMLPDGGGSASSYVPIPRLKADVAIVGLNCPYARDPENMNCTHQAMIACFVNEIKRRQPQGPYHLGGWSSGGAFAYVVAEALVNGGDEVHAVIVIDAPVPQVMEKLPDSFYQHCNSIGLFANQPGGGVRPASMDGTGIASEPPPYLIPHFQAVVDVMLDYKVAPLKTARMPKVGIIWAANTVLEEANAPKMKGMHFMVQKRTDFGPDGWDTVFPGAEFVIMKATGANHFTLMVSRTMLLSRSLCTACSARQTAYSTE